MTRPQRKRKPPASADASPVAAVPGSTHAMASRKRSRPATAAASEDMNNAAVAAAEAEEAAQPKKPRAVKKPARAAVEHAVAQAVPPHIGDHQAQADQQLDAVHVAVAANPNPLAAGATSTPAAPNQVAQQVQAAPAQAHTSPQGSGSSQTSNPSSLLLLAQQQMQMQQRFNQQTQLPSSKSLEGLPQGSAPGNRQELQQLGNATAQQALLAQLITQQAAQGLPGYALDGTMHPFFSQGLAGALLRQGMPAQQQASTNQEQSQQAAQQHLQHSTAALLMQQGAGLQMPKAGLLYPGQVIAPGSILPISFQGQLAGAQPSGPQAVLAPQAAQTAQDGTVESCLPHGSDNVQPEQSLAATQAAAVRVSEQVSDL